MLGNETPVHPNIRAGPIFYAAVDDRIVLRSVTYIVAPLTHNRLQYPETKDARQAQCGSQIRNASKDLTIITSA
jgi:hypothetical protein